MIQVKNLTKIYNGVTVLNLPDLNINNGECFGLVGNNGAGKTTFFRLILDLIKADSGFILSNDKDVTLFENWKEYTGAYIDEGFLINFLTPLEYFDFISNLNKIPQNERDTILDTFKDFCSDDVLNNKKYIRELSKGNQKKVGIIGALMINPEILILDEPFPNLDPTSVFKLKKLLKEYADKKNMTMLISSHDLNHVTEVCTRIAILEEGKIIRDQIKTEDTLKELERYFAAE